jgi:hypothetical protein
VLAGDLPGDATGALTVTVAAAAGSVVIAILAAASAVAVSVTEVTEVAVEATGICACIWYEAGDTEVASVPITQVADPFPLGHRPVKVATWPCGAALSVTDTPEAGPFWAETCTVYDAAWPRVIAGSEAWTVTHSSVAGEGDDETLGEDEALGDGPADRGSHWELVAAGAADAAGIPVRLTRPPARQPPDIRHAASSRAGPGRIWAALSRGRAESGGRRPRKRMSNRRVVLPGIVSGY